MVGDNPRDRRDARNVEQRTSTGLDREQCRILEAFVAEVGSVDAARAALDLLALLNARA
jgi:hypothetical protein